MSTSTYLDGSLGNGKQITLATTGQTFYTVPPTSGGMLRDCRLKADNYTSAIRLVTIYGVYSGEAAATSNAEAYQIPVPPFNYVEIPIKVLPASASIQALCDADTSVTLSLLSGRHFVP